MRRGTSLGRGSRYLTPLEERNVGSKYTTGRENIRIVQGREEEQRREKTDIQHYVVDLPQVQAPQVIADFTPLTSLGVPIRRRLTPTQLEKSADLIRDHQTEEDSVEHPQTLNIKRNFLPESKNREREVGDQVSRPRSATVHPKRSTGGVYKPGGVVIFGSHTCH